MYLGTYIIQNGVMKGIGVTNNEYYKSFHPHNKDVLFSPSLINIANPRRWATRTQTILVTSLGTFVESQLIQWGKSRVCLLKRRSRRHRRPFDQWYSSNMTLPLYGISISD